MLAAPDLWPMLAYYVHHLSPFIFQFPNGFGPHWYGLAYVLGFVCGYQVYRTLAERGYSELKPDQVGDFITWTAMFGVFLGGRLGYFIFYQPETLLHHPLTFFLVWEGGMASHGGILGVFFFTLWYARRHHLSWAGLGDNIVVVTPIGLFFGRLANFINGELYGRITDVPWAVQFPAELRDPAIAQELLPRLIPALTTLQTTHPAAIADPSYDPAELIITVARTNPQLRQQLSEILHPRHPSQLYEAALEGLVLFTLLWLLRTHTNVRRGVLTGVFFIAYALLRIIGEQFREPDAPLVGPFTRGQFLSLFMILTGLAFLLWSRSQPTCTPKVAS